jgi:hypothetical protein
MAVKGKRKTWTPEEDRLVIDGVAKFGAESWVAISMTIDGRTPRMVRERYRNHLQPGLAGNLPWTSEEDAALLSLVNELGPQLARISRMLPGRSTANVKNRYYYHFHGPRAVRVKKQEAIQENPLPPLDEPAVLAQFVSPPCPV